MEEVRRDKGKKTTQGIKGALEEGFSAQNVSLPHVQSIMRDTQEQKFKKKKKGNKKKKINCAKTTMCPPFINSLYKALSKEQTEI